MLSIPLFCFLFFTDGTLPLSAKALEQWLPDFSFKAENETRQQADQFLSYEYEEPSDDGVFLSYRVQQLESKRKARDYFKVLDETVQSTFSDASSEVRLVLQGELDYGDLAAVYQVENAGEIVGMVNLICDGKQVFQLTLMGAYLENEDIVPFMQPVLDYRL